MNHAEALSIVETLSQQSPHFKSMDITSQLTQLNALVKVSGLSPIIGNLRVPLEKCMKYRQIKLQISLTALCVLESEWVEILDRLHDIYLSPESSEAL